MALYQRVVNNLYSGLDSLGECISFDWPSKGYVFGYLPDRAEARQAAQDFADVMSDLYDWMLMKQYAVAADEQNACKAKTSVIAHSMGNYVFENAMNYAWTQKNRPLLVSLIQEALMVAADVDNDLFRSGETVKAGDGEGIANLTYRVTALYSGRDAVLGASAGLKHFGKRRLGRSGLDRTCPVPDNVWDIDCSQLIAANVGGLDCTQLLLRPQGVELLWVDGRASARYRPQRSHCTRIGPDGTHQNASHRSLRFLAPSPQRHRENRYAVVDAEARVSGWNNYALQSQKMTATLCASVSRRKRDPPCSRGESLTSPAPVSARSGSRSCGTGECAPRTRRCRGSCPDTSSARTACLS